MHAKFQRVYNHIYLYSIYVAQISAIAMPHYPGIFLLARPGRQPLRRHFSYGICPAITVKPLSTRITRAKQSERPSSRDVPALLRPESKIQGRHGYLYTFVYI